MQPELIVVAAYGKILPQQILDLPRLGCINLHASLLPRHRGASPIAAAIAAGDTHTGMTLMQIEAGLDTGPMLAQASLPIDSADTCATLTERLSQLGATLLLEHLPALIAQQLSSQPQDNALATYAPMLKKSDGCIDWAQPAISIQRLVRAMNPWPTATFNIQDKTIKLWDSRVLSAINAPAGQVVQADKHGVMIACGQQGLELIEVQPPGKGRMPAKAWCAGRHITAGAQLLR